jgi:hypothetical protein
MICRIAGIRGSTPRMHDTPSCLGGGVHPWGRYLQISPIRAPIGWFLGCPGDEIAKTGAHCLRKTPDCLPIAGFSGFTASKKGPNRPNCAGDIYLHGLPYVGIPERGYGDPVRSTGTRVTMEIGSLTRQMTSPDPPTWGPRVYPVGQRWQVPDPSHSGDEITKTGAYCFRKTPNCLPIGGFAGFTDSKKGPNGPNCAGENSPHGLPDAKKGKPGSGDPGRNAPGFPGTGSEQEENTRDTNGGIRL